VKARDQVAELQEAVEQRQVVMVVQRRQRPADRLLVKARDQVAVLQEAVEPHPLNRTDISTTIDKQAYLYIRSNIFLLNRSYLSLVCLSSCGLSPAAV
jgi:hypothetical protein